MTNLKLQAPLEAEACEVVMTIPMSVSTNLSRFDAGLAVRVLMKMKDLNRIFIAPVAPPELQFPSRPQVGAVSGPIPPPIGQKAASEIGAWPDSAAMKTLHRVAQVLGSAAANARISAEVPDLPQLHHQDLSPLPEPLLGLLASISVGQRLRAAAVVA